MPNNPLSPEMHHRAQDAVVPNHLLHMVGTLALERKFREGEALELRNTDGDLDPLFDIQTALHSSGELSILTPGSDRSAAMRERNEPALNKMRRELEMSPVHAVRTAAVFGAFCASAVVAYPLSRAIELKDELFGNKQ